MRVWLRRLSDLSQSHRTSLKYHHRLGLFPETAIVVQMPFEHLFQPCSGLGNGVMHSFAQLHLDRLQLVLNIRFLIVLRPMTNEPHFVIACRSA